MGFRGRLRLTALALGLLMPLAACSEETPTTPDTEVGDQIEGRAAELDPGERTAVLTPAGRLKVGFADPVSRLASDRATDLRARNAPEGGSFVPVVWSLEDRIYGDIDQLFGDRQPLEIALVADGESYGLTPPDATSGRTAEYVAVEGPGEDLGLEVTYDGVTQTLDAETGKLDKGVAKGLYDLPKVKVRLKDCPVRGWFTAPMVYPQYECRYSTAVPSPYVANEWVKPGHSWLSVTVFTNLAMYATGDITGALASYRVKGSTELSTIDGKKPLGTLREQIAAGYAGGTLVFDIKGKLPKTMRLLREYQLHLNGAAGKSKAPEKRTVKIGGTIDLFY